METFAPKVLPSSLFADTQLWALWREWLPNIGQASLDKWLKLHFRTASKGASSTQKKSSQSKSTSSSSSSTHNAALTQAMLTATRFQQLACALEFAYQHHGIKGQTSEIDWRDWDSRWQPKDLRMLPTNVFWFWISQRIAVIDKDAVESHTNTTSRAPGVGERDLCNLKDANARQEFFSRLIQQDYFNQSDAAYLWLGLRPQWRALIRQRQQASGWPDSTTQLFLEYQTSQPPLWLRLQSTETPQQMCGALVAQGVNAGLDPDHGIFAQGGMGIAGTDQYKSGELEIQDLASQMIARAVAALPGQKVWDACAGAGGKTLAIAKGMGNKGAVIATDLHTYKLEETKRRAKRAGVFNIRTFCWAGDAPLALPREVAQQQGFDWVLVDAPCTSSGTWRRNPDARWRFTAEDTQELIQLQRTILLNVAPAVRVLGKLVYATCSWQVSENEEQVSWFLACHPNFQLDSQRIVGAPELNSDTMFVAVLTRQA